MPSYSNPNTSITGYDIIFNPNLSSNIRQGQQQLETLLNPNFNPLDEGIKTSDTLKKIIIGVADHLPQAITENLDILRDSLVRDEDNLLIAIRNAIIINAVETITDLVPIVPEIIDLYSSARRTVEEPNFANLVNLARNISGVIPGLAEAEQALETAERFGRLAKSIVTAGENFAAYLEEPSFQNAAILFNRFRITANKADIFLRSLEETIDNIQEGTEVYIGSDVQGTAVGIVIQFRGGASYRYLRSVIGQGRLEYMITLAETGSGLNSYINKEVRQLYS